jgi:molecular chaperone GrpE (heat shock protein)
MRGNGFCVVAFAATAMGIVLPGCLWSEDESIGRICASPAQGGEYCVPATWDPASVWADAEKNGSLPIQMWAEWPKETTLDELVKDPDKLHRWFADIDKVTKYVRDTQGSAESYRASLDGRQRDLLKQVTNHRMSMLPENSVDAIGGFKSALTTRANAEKDPLVATLALDKESIADVKNILDGAKGDLDPLAKQYAGLVKDFSTYRESEATEKAAYAAFAKEASKAPLEDLDSIEQAILKTGQNASAKPNDLIMAALKLSADLHLFALSSQASLEPHADVLRAHGANSPDMTSGALRSLDAMLGYIDKRVARSDATAKGLIIGVGMRRKALELLAANPLLRAQVAQAKFIGAGALFGDMAKTRIDGIQEAPSMNLKVNLPYLAKRYDTLIGFLQMKPLCDPLSSSWREAGCVSLRNHFDEAETALKTTLPSQIASDIALMKTKGVDTKLLDLAKAKLDAGDIKGAAVLHDAALRSSEGT